VYDVVDFGPVSVFVSFVSFVSLVSRLCI